MDPLNYFKGTCDVYLVKNNHNKIWLFASLFYLKIGLLHKLLCISQSHNKDLKKKNLIFLSMGNKYKRFE